MIDLQTAADGVGRLRIRHTGGTEGVLIEVLFNHDGTTWAEGGGRPRRTLGRHFLVAALDDGGRIEAPQGSFEVVG